MSRYLRHHGHFAIALVTGGVVFAILRALDLSPSLLAAGDVFFLVFLGLNWRLVFRQTPHALEHSAESEDEGIAIVILVTLLALGFFSEAVFVAMNQKGHIDQVQLGLAVAGAPLGWFMLHTVMTFHYANLYYFRGSRTDPAPSLDFPHTLKPGLWDFAYFSFVIGMTAQVSDVQVGTAALRRTVLCHSLISYFFTTVFIAMAVNAVVTMAS